jgi:hypothetical protein
MHACSNPPQPSNKIASDNQQPTARRRGYSIGKHLRESPTLQIKIGASVTHGGVEAGVAEPLTDGDKIDTGF